MNKRLLLYFSYIGTNYRGLQRLVPTTPDRAPDLESVQGILEFGLHKVLQIPRGQLQLFTSSRTDSGVHALESTAQFDLRETERRFGLGAYSPERLCQSLNLFLEKNECDIRIRRIVEVPRDFNCRRAASRIYEYRLAVLNEVPIRVPQLLRLSSATSILDLDRCHPVSGPFNLGAAQNACKLFLGKWDFSTFMKTSHDTTAALPHHRIKTIFRFSITPEIVEDPDFDSFSSSVNKPPYEVYKVTIQGSGFLRQQVRRMVGCLVSVGRGFITGKEIQWMLDNPSEQNWRSHRVETVGASGLFLKQINYPPTLQVLRGYLQ